MDSSKFRSKRIAALFAGIILNSGVTKAATFFTDASQLPATVYDFVVVGAGNAGNVVASRLTEDGTTTVLLIEAGVSHEGIDSIAVPGLVLENLPFSPVMWNYTTVPQAALDNRPIPYAKGRVIGGSSAVNFMEYTRSSNTEYDRWANLTGDSGWAWENMEQYYLKNSRLVPPSDGHDTTGEVDPSVHGTGPVPLSLAGTPNPLDARMLAATQAPGAEFPFRLDMNGGDMIGFGLTQSTINNGERMHSGKAFLEPAMARPNLHVLIENTVTRLLQTNTTDGLPSFMNVEFARDAHSARSVVTATKEVVLSAGSIGTPQILMLSGIGDREELTAVGVNVTVDNPAVGKHLIDHPIMANYFEVNSTETYDDVLRNPDDMAKFLAEWKQNRTGPMVASPATGLGFFRLPDDDPIFQKFSDPSPGEGAGHIELILSNQWTPEVQAVPATGNYLTIHAVVVSPASEGTVRLSSTDPFEFPLMDPQFLASEFDQHTIVTAAHLARAFVSASPWADYVVSRTGIIGDTDDNDDDLLAAARQATVTIWHPMCTARMAPKGSTDGAIDPDLLVKGVSGLRVIDGSSLPAIPATHPMAPIYLLAERGSDLIKQKWNL